MAAMFVYTAVIVLVSILELRQMAKEKLVKEILLFIPLAMTAIALAALYSFRPETSISEFLLKLFNITY